MHHISGRSPYQFASSLAAGLGSLQARILMPMENGRRMQGNSMEGVESSDKGLNMTC